MKIDYSAFDKKTRDIVRDIENRPHAKYIRYLFTKRYSPAQIKSELFRAGFSCPMPDHLHTYYMAVIDPAISHFSLGKYYAKYKKAINTKRGVGKNDPIFSMRVDLTKEPKEAQKNFLKFISYLDIVDLYGSEILRFYGGAEGIPVDENGEKLVRIATREGYVRVLYHEKRYVVDKLLLEHMTDSRIIEYLFDKHGVTNLRPADIRGYRQLFFDVTSIGIEDTISTLEYEKECLKDSLKEFMESDEYADLSVSEKHERTDKIDRRIEDLSDAIRMLTAQHADAVYGAKEASKASYEAMFADVMQRSYARFIRLDADPRMDVIDPMFKTATLMKNAHEHILDIQDREERHKAETKDRSSGEIIMELYKKRADEVADEELSAANNRLLGAGSEFTLDPSVTPDEIDGLAELGFNIADEDKE